MSLGKLALEQKGLSLYTAEREREREREAAEQMGYSQHYFFKDGCSRSRNFSLLGKKKI